MRAHKNRTQLNEFVSDFALQDQNSNIKFLAKVELETVKNQLSTNCVVMVQYGGYNTSGELTLIDTENVIDAYKFPEVFKLDYQDFSYTNKTNLLITGTHPSIGKYEIVITPTNE